MAFRHIILATDFSEGAERAADAAIELAVQFDAKITVLHVYSIPMMSYSEGVAFPLAQLEEAAKEALNAALARLKLRWPKVDALLACGVPWQQIVAAVEERRADVVVLGTHGRRGLARALLGSVAEKVVRLSPVPVLVVPGPRRDDK
jgi:nucleotide-binding universal stress UspA family protein